MAQSDLSKIDLRVGRVLAVDKHPEADALYVEKIDLGEAKPRVVVSGLVKYMSPAQLQGQLAVASDALDRGACEAVAVLGGEIAGLEAAAASGNEEMEAELALHRSRCQG